MRAGQTAVTCFLLATVIGCGRSSVSEDEALATLVRALGAEPPSSCRLLGRELSKAEDAVATWVFVSQEPLRPADEMHVTVRQQIPAETLTATVRRVVNDDYDFGRPLPALCNYVEWSTSEAAVRMRQLQTQRECIATIEIFPELP